MTDNPPPFAQHAQPLEYVIPTRVRRPSLLTAIGVISIVVASISILANLMAAFQTAGMLLVARMPMSGATTSTTVTVSASDGTPTTVVEDDWPDGWPAPARKIAIEALAELRSLNSARRKQLDDLLAQGGRQVFPFDPQLVTRDLVKANVTDHGTLQSQTFQSDAVYFLVGNGRIELDDNQAAFVPSPGSGAEAVEVGALASQSDPEIRSAGPATTPVGLVGNPLAGIHVVPATLVILESILSLLLAILLLVAGIFVLRDSTRAVPLHRFYAWTKLPLAIGGAIAYYWLWTGFMTGMLASVPPTAAGGNVQPMTAMRIGFAVTAGVMAVVACIYPIALLIALRARRVREYVNVIGEERR